MLGLHRVYVAAQRTHPRVALQEDQRRPRSQARRVDHPFLHQAIPKWLPVWKTPLAWASRKFNVFIDVFVGPIDFLTRLTR
jgi:hypothetical protein